MNFSLSFGVVGGRDVQKNVRTGLNVTGWIRISNQHGVAENGHSQIQTNSLCQFASHEQKPCQKTCHWNTACKTGILKLIYCNPHITGKYNPPKHPQQPGFFSLPSWPPDLLKLETWKGDPGNNFSADAKKSQTTKQLPRMYETL